MYAPYCAVGVDTSVCIATKYSVGNSEFVENSLFKAGKILSTNTVFPGRIKQVSGKVDGLSNGFAGVGTAGKESSLMAISRISGSVHDGGRTGVKHADACSDVYCSWF